MGKLSDALSKAGADIESAVVSEEKKGGGPGTAENRPTKRRKKSEQAPLFSLNESCEGWDERLVAAMKNYPGVAESFRRLRAKILHPADGKSIKSILVISASQGEGKSFVCANLGAVMAQGVNQHALMVDCDLRRPNLAKLFGMDSREGLVDYLSGNSDLSYVIRPTGLKRLSVIPGGMPPTNPSELLSSHKMATLIEEMVNRYQDRFILLDSPPAQAASETAVLAQQVDKVVLVVRWSGSGREQIKKLVDQIGKDKLLGVVFNAFEMNILDKKMQGEGYSNYYAEDYS